MVIDRHFPGHQRRVSAFVLMITERLIHDGVETELCGLRRGFNDNFRSVGNSFVKSVARSREGHHDLIHCLLMEAI